MNHELKQERRKVVLIDDDPVFCSIMLAAANENHINLDAFQSLREIGYIGKLSQYRVAIVDFELEEMNGIEIARYLTSLFPNLPMILVSCQPLLEISQGQLPPCVKGYFQKSFGYTPIINSTRELLYAS